MHSGWERTRGGHHSSWVGTVAFRGDLPPVGQSDRGRGTKKEGGHDEGEVEVSSATVYHEWSTENRPRICLT